MDATRLREEHPRNDICVDIIGCVNLTLTLLAESFTIHRFNAKAKIPLPALRSPFFAITRTDDELSLVLPDSVEIARSGRRARESKGSDSGWACFKVEGPLEFGLVGVLAGIAGALAEAGVPIFALSTFDTDYILVKREQVRAAKEALTSAGYWINAS